MEKCDCGGTGAIAYAPKGTPNGPQTETWPVGVCPECGGHGTKLTLDEVRQLRNEEAARAYSCAHPKANRPLASIPAFRESIMDEFCIVEAGLEHAGASGELKDYYAKLRSLYDMLELVSGALIDNDHFQNIR